MNKQELYDKLQNSIELDPDKHDGSYYLVRETIKAYVGMDFSKLDYKDLNLVYLMTVGSWKHGPNKRIQTINDSNLPQAKKDDLIEVLHEVVRETEAKYYSNWQDGNSFGMFGTGFYTFITKTDLDSVSRFIKMCTEILPLEDDEKIFDIAEKTLSTKIKGMGSGAASMVLHCLKPFTFPIFNANSGNENAFKVLGLNLKKYGDITSYIPNCRIIKKYRDENFDIKNYRIFDMAVWEEPTDTSIYEEKIKELISSYKLNFAKIDSEERYKWEAIKWYKDHWDIDAPDFASMVEVAFEKFYNLLRSGMYYPHKMLCEFAKEDPETVRGLFKMLYNEDLTLEERFIEFRDSFEKFTKPKKLNHYQDLHAVSVYLAAEYPDSYYIYKYAIYKGLKDYIGYQSEETDKGEVWKWDDYSEMLDILLDVIVEDEELMNMSANRLDKETCFQDENCVMLTMDVAYYASKLTPEYWPSEEEYNPNLSKDDWKEYILKIEKPDHPSPMKMLKGMMELGGEASCKKLSQVYGGTVSAYVGCTMNLGRRVKKYFDLPACMDGEQERYFPIPFLGRKINEDGVNEYSYKIRPELLEALKEIDLSDISPEYDEEAMEATEMDMNKNIILYGPPGTGKTYNTAIYAVSIIEKQPLSVYKGVSYQEILDKYNEYKNKGFIKFTTFHQSYGYEEFIEGIKPVMNNDDTANMQYEVVPGMFKSFCEQAGRPILKKKENIGFNDSPTIWKVSLQGTGDNATRTECFENDHIRIGYDSYGEDITSDTDFSNDGGKNVLTAMIYNMRIGDIVLSCYSANTIDGIGIITGDYEWHDEYEHYKRVRNVKWIVKGIKEDILNINGGKTLTLSSVYKLNNITLNNVMDIINKYSDKNNEVEPNNNNYVFIIDEINRGNISKIFGELITLIEPTKRLGQPEALTAQLPYSPKPFGVPSNVYIIGTMNTADRSIATIDTALRRRFDFKEMMPDSSVVADVTVEGINISEMLDRMNKKIEVLYDREHTIGHAFFTPLLGNASKDVLGDIFKNKIIPLLQEYFYEDYEKIRLVLGDNNKEDESKQFIIIDKETDIPSLFGNTEFDFEDINIYKINKDAFYDIDAYKSI